MLTHWPDEIEALEAISQDDDMRRIFLRLSALVRDGSLPVFLNELARDRGLDDETKHQVFEIVSEPTFLIAVEEYLRCTHRVH
jgi:hypothetical protein